MDMAQNADEEVAGEQQDRIPVHLLMQYLLVSVLVSFYEVFDVSHWLVAKTVVLIQNQLLAFPIPNQSNYYRTYRRNSL